MLSEESVSNDDNGPQLPTRENGISSGSKSSTSLSARMLTPSVQPKYLRELEGKEKKDAIGEIKASLKKKIRDNGGVKSMVGQLTNVVCFFRISFELLT